MSDDGREPGPEPAPIPEPTPLPSGSPSTGEVIGGVFLIGCGLCLVLVGGGCTFLFVMVMAQTNSARMGGELLMPVALLVAGIVALVLGIRLIATKRSG